MKLSNVAVAASALVVSTSAFVPAPGPRSFGVVSPRISRRNDVEVFLTPASSFALHMSDDKDMFFAELEDSELPEMDKEMTVEEEVEELVKVELAKNKKMSNLRNANGVDYAPWMGISADDETKIRQLVSDKAIARRKRQQQEKDVSGNLYLDSQAQELSGTGLNFKLIGDEVELEFGTKSEKNTAGFVVRRRKARDDEWVVIESYKDWGPLESQGVDGGIYRYMDTSAGPGGWVYRISEVDNKGAESDLCQCLVEIQTAGEKTAGLVAGVGIVVIAIAAVAAGILLDPLNGQ
mmetsp:Transcript_13628/g.27159  ORF Transcript_13628/g.27159 Transcript_13628/m.27159 type:complete len:293 (+) Transcript_13628:153-1031(+)|eukprot:CAMPEP_0194305492 /NCGR_PEP_ID=MMETSP0171-20130528/2918_1 /TAXON_ID=218684 /ORGANISM="Corethron pennatum, Strain L29A3" /LENGTH=292 /DNA_ID=CAMNT_0039057041 /DNA_START=102 /DNA_END=980 /DNA_ORIENTATION=+